MVQIVETSSVSVQEHSTRLATNRSCPELPLPQNYSTLPILTRQQITARIVSGQLLVIHLPLVYRIPQSWLKLHPGGDLAILHYVGRDASNEIEVYHSGRTVQQRMARWIVGKVQVDEEGWRDMVPPVQLGMWPLPVPRITVSTPSHSLSEDSAETIRPIDNDEIELGAKFLTPSLVNPISPKSDLLPLTPSYQHHLRQSHRRLHAKLHELDLMSPPPFLSGYGPSLVIYISLFLAFVFTYMRAASLGGYVMSAIFLGAWWHQITFVAHDAGHTGLTGDWYNDRVMGTLITNFMGGISLGWWADNHNVHHLVTNSPEHDPDIQHLPFFAISTKFFAGLSSSYYKRVMVFDGFSKFVLPYQHKLYYIIMCFARFNLFANSYIFMLTKWPARASPLFKLRILEFFGVIGFWTWFGLVVRGVEGTGSKIAFVLVSFAVTSPLHVQIVLSHFSQPISITSDIVPHTELLESFAHRQLRTTMDIATPEYLDFLHGGLNFQVPHHLFPRMPRFRFRAAALVVKGWVEAEQLAYPQYQATFKGMGGEGKGKIAEGLIYKKMEFVEANRDVLGVLQSVAQQVKFMGIVAEADAKGEIEH